MISYAFEILKHYLTLPVLLAALLAGDICALLHRGARLRGKIDRRSVVARSLLCAYLVLMFAVLLFAREQKVTHRFELELFWSYRAIGEGYRYLLYQDIFNVLLFVPFGLLWPAAFRARKPWMTLLAGLGMSLVGELFQAATARGLFELDDLFHNFLGTALGLGLWTLVRKLWRGKGSAGKGSSCDCGTREHARVENDGK